MAIPMPSRIIKIQDNQHQIRHGGFDPAKGKTREAKGSHRRNERAEQDNALCLEHGQQPFRQQRAENRGHRHKNSEETERSRSHLKKFNKNKGRLRIITEQNAVGRSNKKTESPYSAIEEQTLDHQERVNPRGGLYSGLGQGNPDVGQYGCAQYYQREENRSEAERLIYPSAYQRPYRRSKRQRRRNLGKHRMAFGSFYGLAQNRLRDDRARAGTKSLYELADP